MSKCTNSCQNSSVHQTLDELDFERGIWFAAQHNDISRVEDLINKFKNVDAQDKAGYTALHYASRNGHLEVCKLLISNGANVNALTRCGKVTALHSSQHNTDHFKVTDIMKRNHFSPLRMPTAGKVGETFGISGAASSGHNKIFQLLLKFGASIDLKDADGKTVLHRAVEGEHIDLVKEILQIGPQLKNEIDNKGKLPKDYVKMSSPLLDLFNNDDFF